VFQAWCWLTCGGGPTTLKASCFGNPDLVSSSLLDGLPAVETRYYYTIVLR
jgi:hypothetical protein